MLAKLMRKVHVIIDEKSIKKAKKNVKEHDLVICSKGVCDDFDFVKDVHRLNGFSVSKEAALFAKDFRVKYKELTVVFDFIIASQINDIFKFIFLELLEICEYLTALDETEIVLYNGTDNVSFISIFMASNTEVSKPIFSSRSRILNPLLYDWLTSNSEYSVDWFKESFFKLIGVKLLRNLAIYSISTLIVVKSISFINSKIASKVKAVAIYRSSDQLKNLQVINNYFVDEFVLIKGPSISINPSSISYNIISLPVFFKSIYFSIKHFISSYIFKDVKVKIKFLGGYFTLNNNHITNEAALLVTSYAHYFGIRDTLKKTSVEFLFSSELLSRYAILEKLALKSLCVKTKLVGVQFVSLGNLVIPLFPVQDKLIAKSKNDEELILSIYKRCDVKFLGSFSVTNFFKGEIKYRRYNSKNIVFFTQPYGIEDNKKIVISILNVLPKDWSFIVRNHPRDCFKYEQLSSKVKSDRNAFYLKSLVEADLVITKTSSVLSECLDFEKKHAAIVIDSYSQSIIDSIAGVNVHKLFSFHELEEFLRDVLPKYNYTQDVCAPQNLLVSKSEIQNFLT